MRVTKEQVERLADARREYETALRDITRPGSAVKWVGEPLASLEMLRALADAAGERVECDDFGGHRTHRFYCRGVDFYRIERTDGGGA